MLSFVRKMYDKYNVNWLLMLRLKCRAGLKFSILSIFVYIYILHTVYIYFLVVVRQINTLNLFFLLLSKPSVLLWQSEAAREVHRLVINTADGAQGRNRTRCTGQMVSLLIRVTSGVDWWKGVCYCGVRGGSRATAGRTFLICSDGVKKLHHGYLNGA